MSTASLTTRYRPQRFADVAGQETVTSILSRAAAEDSIAPAYLFSGTRGVGKTTVARILAKAVNCKNGPAAEPCNECLHCRQITQGMAVDVVEIDGASNRGIDDARRMKEDIGYAPMECRYKVFIIDEAHMLTKEAFNALLKTLEEPPRNVTFILATTEHHKFPATIISRCQHYTFKRLTHRQLTEHLTDILNREEKSFEPQAVSLLARRAAGSVRDSMSLLGQVMALGKETVAVDDVRSILGLAGQEVFFGVMRAIRDQDAVSVSSLLRDILDQGLDLGFFLRELAQAWRNLFLLGQAGEQALPMLELADEDGAEWLSLAGEFSLTHVHACWQMTLEAQRKVLISLEPAMALELLLLNLAFLPRLLPLERMGAVPGEQGGQPAHGGAPSPATPTGPVRPAPGSGREHHRASGPSREQGGPGSDKEGDPPGRVAEETDTYEPGEPPAGERTREGFFGYYLAEAGRRGFPKRLGPDNLVLEGDLLNISCRNDFHKRQVAEEEHGRWLEDLVRRYFGPRARLEVQDCRNFAEVLAGRKEAIESNPLVQELKKELGATLIVNSIKGR